MFYINMKVARIRRLHDFDLIRLISKRLSEHMDVKHISFFHLFQIGEKLRLRQSGMSGQDTVRTFSPYRKGCIRQMPDPFSISASVNETGWLFGA